MSFILDAIAKSEQERQQQQTPDARRLAFPAAAPARPRRTVPWMLAGLLLLGSAILAAVWVQSPWTPVTPFVGTGGPAVPTAPAAGNRPQAPVEPRTVPQASLADSPEPVSTTPLPAASEPAETVARRQPPASEVTVVEPAASMIEALPTGSAGETAPESAATAPAGGIDAAESRRASLEPDSGAPAAAAETPPAETEAPRRRVSRLSELPADVRRALPSVVFTGHLYSRNPRASYVFIDSGRQIVVGQQITDDLVLDEITPSGVVVEFQGYLIEVGVLQNWSLK